jgi:glutaconyl-CoA/methylmalonyl-CoA decarboxylase subunit delta
MKIDWSNIINAEVIISSVVTIILIAILYLLYRFFKWISLRYSPDIREKLKSQGKLLRNSNGSHAVPADHSVAIALALYLNNELHDEESNVLTIERVSRIYSPWSSKYYNMRKPPR